MGLGYRAENSPMVSWLEDGVLKPKQASPTAPLRARLTSNQRVGCILGAVAAALCCATFSMLCLIAIQPSHGPSITQQGDVSINKTSLTDFKPNSASLLPRPDRQERQAHVYMHEVKQTPHRRHARPLTGAWNEPCTALQGTLQLPGNNSGSQLVAALVVMAHNRPDYLTRTVGNLIGLWRQDPNNAVRFPLYISVDGSDERTVSRAAELCSDHHYQLQLLNHKQKPPHADGYSRLADHYKWVLRVFFECNHSPRLIFLEDDVLVAPDFFSYFNALAAVMDEDPSLWCVSCWNDNGQPNLVESNTRLYRTDYFPGLGWMTTRDKGLHMIDMWPRTHWDGLLRQQHGPHQCVYPEISRTHTFGAVGTSGGQYFEDILATLKLSSVPVQWEQQDLTYLIPNNYAARMDKWLAEAVPMTVPELVKFLITNNTSSATAAVRVEYTAGNRSSYEHVVKQIDRRIMADVCGSWPRTGYKGIVVVHVQGCRVLLVPSNWKKPTPSVR